MKEGFLDFNKTPAKRGKKETAADINMTKQSKFANV